MTRIVALLAVGMLLAACATTHRAVTAAPVVVVKSVPCPLPPSPSDAKLKANGLVGSNALLKAWRAKVAAAQRACTRK